MKVINGIDGSCYVCAGKAAVELAREFPKDRECIEKLYQKEYGQSLASIEQEWVPHVHLVPED